MMLPIWKEERPGHGARTEGDIKADGGRDLVNSYVLSGTASKVKQRGTQKNESCKPDNKLAVGRYRLLGDGGFVEVFFVYANRERCVWSGCEWGEACRAR